MNCKKEGIYFQLMQNERRTLNIYIFVVYRSLDIRGDCLPFNPSFMKKPTKSEERIRDLLKKGVGFADIKRHAHVTMEEILEVLENN